MRSPCPHQGPGSRAAAPVPAGLRPARLSEKSFQSAAPARPHPGNKAEHCAGLPAPSLPEPLMCALPGSGLNVPFVADLRGPSWVCLGCGRPGLNKHTELTFGSTLEPASITQQLMWPKTQPCSFGLVQRWVSLFSPFAGGQRSADSLATLLQPDCWGARVPADENEQALQPGAGTVLTSPHKHTPHRRPR